MSKYSVSYCWWVRLVLTMAQSEECPKEHALTVQPSVPRKNSGREVLTPPGSILCMC